MERGGRGREREREGGRERERTLLIEIHTIIERERVIFWNECPLRRGRDRGEREVERVRY